MKRFILSILLTLFCIHIDAQYNCVVKSSDRETVTFRVVGYGSNTKKTICFTGAAGTTFAMPLVSSGESKSVSDNSEFFNSFYSEQYRNFIESSIAVSNLCKDASKRKCQTFDVKIRARELRKYLEQNGVIRKFGL